MKIKIVSILVFVILILATFPIISSEQTIENKKSKSIYPDTFLLNTKWGQHGGYKAKCPVNKSNNNINSFIRLD